MPQHIMLSHPILIIGGPTASGKSQLALQAAERYNGIVINADSMQVYREIPVISAQPSAEDHARVPHRLYGFLPATEHFSVARWLEYVRKEIDAAHEVGKLPIIVGGTGLYISTLVQGISPIPESDPVIRARVQALCNEIGNAEFHTLLNAKDPVMAARLPMGDTQRMVRAMEVLEQTGQSLSIWQQQAPVALYPKERFRLYTLIPPRPQLYDQCNKRFITMLEQGAMEEVRRVQGLDVQLTAMKALGISELSAHLRGELSLEEAITLAQQSTRHYAKRQMTWFRNQFPDAVMLENGDLENIATPF